MSLSIVLNRRNFLQAKPGRAGSAAALSMGAARPKGGRRRIGWFRNWALNSMDMQGVG